MENSNAVAEKKSPAAAGKDETAPPPPPPPHADPMERGAVEEILLLSRLELQKTRAMCADADETICKLAMVAQRMMQERDEATSHGSALLAELQAMQGQATLLAGKRHASRIAAGPGRAFAATEYGRGRGAPAATTPYSGMTQLGQHAQVPGGSYFFPSSSSSSSGGGLGAGHCRNLAPWLSIGGTTVAADPPAGFSSTQDAFDPDMFLVEPAAESPQGRVPPAPALLPAASAPEREEGKPRQRT